MSFFFNATSTTEIYTLSLHDALPICPTSVRSPSAKRNRKSSSAASSRSTAISRKRRQLRSTRKCGASRSEEHTSELQSRLQLVCRLLLEKKKNKQTKSTRRKTTHHSI